MEHCNIQTRCLSDNSKFATAASNHEIRSLLIKRGTWPLANRAIGIRAKECRDITVEVPRREICLHETEAVVIDVTRGKVVNAIFPDALLKALDRSVCARTNCEDL